jgi:hypothetical protein
MKIVAEKVIELSKGDYNTALLYSALAGAIISDTVQTPATAWAYYNMRRYKEQVKNGKISDKEAEAKIGRGYYLALPAWWVTVFAVIHFHKGGFDEKAKLAVLLVSTGAIVGTVFKKYVKDLPILNEQYD